VFGLRNSTYSLTTSNTTLEGSAPKRSWLGEFVMHSLVSDETMGAVHQNTSNQVVWLLLSMVTLV